MTYQISFTKAGQYSIESWSISAVLDPTFEDITPSIECDKKDEVKGQDGSQYGNFKVTFEISEEQLNTAYNFGLSGIFRKGPKSYEFAVRYLG